jgi:hypothetical protein
MKDIRTAIGTVAMRAAAIAIIVPVKARALRPNIRSIETK